MIFNIRKSINDDIKSALNDIYENYKQKSSELIKIL
jgi:uncharacterized protein (UPF0297 family)